MNFILMADIVDSSDYSSKDLMEEFKHLVSAINKEFKGAILSPLTITLGDEFQGVISDLKSSVRVILGFEELIIKRSSGFKLRYVLCYGVIDTPLEVKNAYGMLGTGLTETRKRLGELKKSFNRFEFISFPVANHMNKLFVLFQHFVDSWHVKDLPVVAAFLEEPDYKEVAKKIKKDPSTMWRRERSLAISEYQVCKDLILADAGD